MVPLLSAELPAVPVFGPAHLVLDQVERCFRRLRHTVWHKLRVASGYRIMRGLSRGQQTRFVRCAWGVRQDEYRWRTKDGFEDFTAFRAAAAAMGWALVHTPEPCWVDLLPGTMAELMETRSGLYLADYWILVLHHLLWSKRLPYPIKARWVQGASVHDRPFYFISELPIDLAEVSMDALILFREAIFASPGGSVLEAQAPIVASARPSEPPVYRDGAWHLAPRDRQPAPGPQTEPCVLVASTDTAEPRAAPVSIQQETTSLQEPAPRQEAAPGDSCEQEKTAQRSTAPQLNDQSFTVTFGGSTYRFTARNKQLFAFLERISRRPGFRVSFDDLRSTGDVWDGLNVEDSTIRGAVTRLRKLLGEHGMSELAVRITTGTYRGTGYVVLGAAEDNESET